MDWIILVYTAKLLQFPVRCRVFIVGVGLGVYWARVFIVENRTAIPEICHFEPQKIPVSFFIQFVLFCAVIRGIILQIYLAALLGPVFGVHIRARPSFRAQNVSAQFLEIFAAVFPRIFAVQKIAEVETVIFFRLPTADPKDLVQAIMVGTILVFPRLAIIVNRSINDAPDAKPAAGAAPIIWGVEILRIVTACPKCLFQALTVNIFRTTIGPGLAGPVTIAINGEIIGGLGEERGVGLGVGVVGLAA